MNRQHLIGTPDENLVFGIDVGIASCGWAVVDRTQGKERILAIGAHCFEKPEKDKNNELLNFHRRSMRGQRKVIRRRAGRVRRVRQFIRNSLLPDFPLASDEARDYYQRLERQVRDKLSLIPDDTGTSEGRATDALPWLLRRDGLCRKLSNEEMALVLIHLAKHRGFKSNAKSDQGGDAPDDSKKVLQAIHSRAKRTEQYQTFGALAMADPMFAERKRNRKDVYTHTPTRSEIADEAGKIIAHQKEQGAEWATEDFISEFHDIAFSQKGLQSSEHLVGMCPFESNEKRAARYAPSFELFRVLQKIAHESVTEDDLEMPRNLTSEERRKVAQQIGEKRSITWKGLKKLLGMQTGYRFKGAPDDKAEEGNITGNTKGDFPGSYTLHRVLGANTWEKLWEHKPHVLDQMAAILSFNESLDDIKVRLNTLLKQEPQGFDLEVVMQACEQGEFSTFKGAAHVSAKAARNINRYLVQDGMVYSSACEAAGYDHAVADLPNVDDIKNPTVARSVRKAIKQARALHRKFGVPGRIHVELLRDVGKSAKERSAIEKGIKKLTDEKRRLRKEFAKHNGISEDEVTPNNIEMLAMLEEQKYECAFCAAHVLTNRLVGGHVNFAHIYPRSAFPDNSFNARVLSCAQCNQRQGSRTPWEWHEQGEFTASSWEEFAARVKGFNCKKEKKRRLLDKNFRKRLINDPQFANRHRVDSSYIARTVMSLLKQEFYASGHSGGQVTKGNRRRVLARPGPLTAVLRRAWLQGIYKKDRDDDRHHAMDALVTACTDEAMLQSLTSAWQMEEQEGRYKWTPNLAPPWGGFIEQAQVAYEGGQTGEWYVCRTEKRRVRGPLHDASFRRKRKNANSFLVRQEVTNEKEFKEDSLAKVLDPNANWRLIECLAGWLMAGRPDTTQKLSAESISEAEGKLPDCMAKLAMIHGLDNTIRERWQGSDIANQIADVLRQWQNIGPKEGKYRHLPLSLKGDTIRRIRVDAGPKTARQIHGHDMGGKQSRGTTEGGFVENAHGGIVRTDVFHVTDGYTDPDGKTVTKGYYLVPIYNWQILDPGFPTPQRAIVAHKDENDWPLMREADFLFSLYPGSWVEIVDKSGELVSGYYRRVDRSSGKLIVSPSNKHVESMGKNTKTARAMSKSTIDLLGNKHLVHKEKYPGVHEKRRDPRVNQ